MSITTNDADVLDRADMRRLAGGQDAALNDLMERHGLRVYQYLCRILGNEADAEDLAQETFARVYRARDRFRSGEKFTTWLYTIASNLARSHHRWRARHPNVSFEEVSAASDQPLESTLSGGGPDPSGAAVMGERAELVRRAVDGLPMELCEAIVLCEWEDRSVGDAAAILGTTRKAVESRLYRARRLLRKELQRWL